MKYERHLIGVVVVVVYADDDDDEGYIFRESKMSILSMNIIKRNKYEEAV